MRLRRPALLLLLALAACGEDAVPDPAAAARERLEAFFAAVRAGDPEEVARYVLYRGGDALRHERDLIHWPTPEERSEVDALMSRVRRLLEGGAPRYLAFEVHGPKPASWRSWTVAFGEGPEAPTAVVTLAFARGVLAVASVEPVPPR